MEHASDGIVDAAHLVGDDVDVTGPLVSRLEILGQQFRLSAQAHQRIADLVGERGRHLDQTLQIIRSAALGLQFARLAQILENDHQPALTIAAAGHHRSMGHDRDHVLARGRDAALPLVTSVGDVAQRTEQRSVQAVEPQDTVEQEFGHRVQAEGLASEEGCGGRV